MKRINIINQFYYDWALTRALTSLGLLQNRLFFGLKVFILWHTLLSLNYTKFIFWDCYVFCLHPASLRSSTVSLRKAAEFVNELTASARLNSHLRSAVAPTRRHSWHTVRLSMARFRCRSCRLRLVSMWRNIFTDSSTAGRVLSLRAPKWVTPSHPQWINNFPMVDGSSENPYRCGAEILYDHPYAYTSANNYNWTHWLLTQSMRRK